MAYPVRYRNFRRSGPLRTYPSRMTPGLSEVGRRSRPPARLPTPVRPPATFGAPTSLNSRPFGRFMPLPAQQATRSLSLGRYLRWAGRGVRFSGYGLILFALAEWFVEENERALSLLYRRSPTLNLAGYELYRNCGPGSHVTDDSSAASCAETFFFAGQMGMSSNPRPVFFEEYTPIVYGPLLDVWRVKPGNRYRRLTSVACSVVVSQGLPFPDDRPAVSPLLPAHYTVPLGPQPLYPKPWPYPAIPYHKADPGLSPDYQRQVGYAEPLPGTRPSAVAMPEAKVEPVGSFGNPTAPRAPPGPNQKERKVRPRSGAVSVMRFLQKRGHDITEALDVLDAIWDALPKKYQGKAKTPQEKAQKLYQHWDKVDMNEAVKNLIENQIEDAIVGRSNAKVNRHLRERVAPYTGNPLGLVRGRVF